MKEGRKAEYPEKTPGDKLQKMPHTKAWRFKPLASTKTECDYLNGWIKKRSHTQKSHPKVVNPRDLAGERKKTKKKKKPLARLEPVQ